MNTQNNNYQEQLKKKFLSSLRHHLSELHFKAEKDFSKSSFKHELRELKRDSVYPQFSLDSSEYVLIRLMGRISISIGRRLGDIYDKIPRFLTSERFNLLPNQVSPKLNNLELDIGLRFSDLSCEDVTHIKQVIKEYMPTLEPINGIGIEIRYNFNPNDSARLRKDIKMAQYVQNEDFLPIYVIFSTISPREDAISRLRRAGWKFLIGDSATRFMKDILGLDLSRILNAPEIKKEVQKEIAKIMEAIFKSYAFKEIIAKYYD